MSLLSLAETNPAAFDHLNIQQVVAICGDGQLLDGSKCSDELRTYLRFQNADKIALYARFCLDNSFQKSGCVLQDIINEIGFRLGFQIKPGRYSGSTREIGFDGLWIGEGGSLIVEAKTTDAYRINLDTVVSYASRAAEKGLCDAAPNALLVVGREDTGDLEAQIRGSRHAWQVRLVSVESLIKLMFVREDVSWKVFSQKMTKILFPFEYTRVDHIIDLVFETQKELEEKIVEVEGNSEASIPSNEEPSFWHFTPTEEIDAKRTMLLDRFFVNRSMQYRRISRSQYVDKDALLSVACTISKRYNRDYQPYWYAFHPSWLELMESRAEGYFILGCMDRPDGFALPVKIIRSFLDKLNRTEKEGRFYWHITLQIGETTLFLNLPKTGERLSLEPYAF